MTNYLAVIPAQAFALESRNLACYTLRRTWTALS